MFRTVEGRGHGSWSRLSGNMHAGESPGSLAETAPKCKVKEKPNSQAKCAKQQFQYSRKLYLKLFSQH